MSQFISLEQAIEMTSLYRKQKDNILKEEYKGLDILATSETFESASIQAVLEGATSVRIYFGMSEDLKIHCILVGVNEKGEDILPSSGAIEATIMNSPPIIENALRCPPICSFASPLNP